MAKHTDLIAAKRAAWQQVQEAHAGAARQEQEVTRAYKTWLVVSNALAKANHKRPYIFGASYTARKRAHV